MNFRNLDIKVSYINQGEEAMAQSLIVPALKCAKLYQRSVGYFSSGVLDLVLDGIASLHRNKGKVQLIASPHLDQNDIEAINLGYETREAIISGSFTKSFYDEIEKFDDLHLQLLAELIANGTLDIKIAITKSNGDYHDKLGILEDNDGNTIVFYGSSNSSKNGYQDNYEKIRVVKSWSLADTESILDEKEEFMALWNNTNPFVDTYDYKESAQKNLLKVIESRRIKKKANSSPVSLYDYQEEARDAWVNNGYRGFFVMATGTGKTWTAIFSAKELLKKHPSTIVICAPYKHLVKQWSEDVEKMFNDATIVMVSSENPQWETQITNAIVGNKYNGRQLIIISTIASFNSDRFTRTIEKDKNSKLLIVDAYGIIGLNSKDSTDKGFLKLSPILFSPQKRLMVNLRRKHAQNEDLSAKRSAACNFGSTVSDVVPSHLLQRQSAEHTPDVDLHRSTVRYPKDVSLACAA